MGKDKLTRRDRILSLQVRESIISIFKIWNTFEAKEPIASKLNLSCRTINSSKSLHWSCTRLAVLGLHTCPGLHPRSLLCEESEARHQRASTASHRSSFAETCLQYGNFTILDDKSRKRCCPFYVFKLQVRRSSWSRHWLRGSGYTSAHTACSGVSSFAVHAVHQAVTAKPTR